MRHHDSWSGYEPGDDFGTVFGVKPTSARLGQALEFNGGGARALARHAVESLLDSMQSVLDRPHTKDEVIAFVRWAYEPPTSRRRRTSWWLATSRTAR